MTTMDFFGRQDQARRASRRFVVLFALAVAVMIALVYWAVMLVVRTQLDQPGWWHWQAFVAVAGGMLAVIGGAAAFQISQLRTGGSYVATMMGGRLVEHGTEDLKERTLLNVVEEMAIASGVPVPTVFVLDGEPGLNAFAAGWGPWDASVAVTRGLLDKLNRDELQGVVAHEFSHVFHGDMRLNIRLMGVLFGILCIAIAGRVVLRAMRHSGGRGRSGKDNPAALLLALGVALLIVGYLGVFFARLIKAAISRQREFLADAAAVQYTRNPNGIGMALAKIGGLGARVQNAHAEEASHMFIAAGVQSWLGGLLATHPPLPERIERVLPGFQRALIGQQDMPAAAATVATPAAAGAAAFAGAATGARQGARADRLVAAVGETTATHLQHARALLQEIPLALHAATRSAVEARHLCCALLLDDDAGRRRDQLALLQQTGDATLAHEVARLHDELRRTPARVRQPLLELCAPALRRLPAADLQQLRRDLRALAEADAVLSPFELMLLKSVERHAPLPEETATRRRMPTTPLLQLGTDAELLLSVLAHHGHPDDPAAAEAAFREGTRSLAPIGDRLRLRPPEACGMRALDAALGRLDQASPLARRQLLLAAARAVGTDGVVAADEGLVLRAVAEAWGCPMPPVWSPDGAMVA